MEMTSDLGVHDSYIVPLCYLIDISGDGKDIILLNCYDARPNCIEDFVSQIQLFIRELYRRGLIDRVRVSMQNFIKSLNLELTSNLDFKELILVDRSLNVYQKSNHDIISYEQHIKVSSPEEEMIKDWVFYTPKPFFLHLKCELIREFKLLIFFSERSKLINQLNFIMNVMDRAIMQIELPRLTTRTTQTVNSFLMPFFKKMNAKNDVINQEDPQSGIKVSR